MFTQENFSLQALEVFRESRIPTKLNLSISKITMFRLNPKKFHNFSFEPKIAIFVEKSQKL